MSATDAFWTLRILPRIGSNAWKSELRAIFAVPSALSPSTMNNSERSRSVLRQSASLAGSEDVSSAVLRRCVSLWVRALMRVFISVTTFSSNAAACCFSPRLVEPSSAPSSCSTTRATMPRTAEVPRTSFVWPSNCGSASRTVSTAVRPASTSSFSSLSLPALSRRALASTTLRNVLSSACSKPATCVPPLDVAMTLTKLRSSTSYPAPQRSAMSTTHSRSTSCEYSAPVASSTGTVSAK